MYGLVLSTSFVRDISHSKRIHRDTITNLCRSSRKIPVTLVRFNKTLIFSTDIRKKNQIPDFI